MLDVWARILTTPSGGRLRPPTQKVGLEPNRNPAAGEPQKEIGEAGVDVLTDI
jgi:hypothetical protein